MHDKSIDRKRDGTNSNQIQENKSLLILTKYNSVLLLWIYCKINYAEHSNQPIYTKKRQEGKAEYMRRT